MKFTKKLKATIITLLALITITPAISTVEPVIVNAKAKTVIAHKKSQFKKGYKYKYNKKKHVYIGHKKKKIKYEDPNKYYPYLCASKPVHKIKPIPDVYTNTPKIDNFTPKVLDKYHLSGNRFSKTNITYTYNNVSATDQEIINGAIKEINDLGIVNLTPATDNADITLNTDNNEPKLDDKISQAQGVTYTYYSHEQKYHGLHLITNANIHIHKYVIKTTSLVQPTEKDLLTSNVVIHEIGHALGLKHIPESVEKDIIMNPQCSPGSISSYDRKHVVIDQYYKNALAILYKN